MEKPKQEEKRDYMKSTRNGGDATERRGSERRLSVAAIMDDTNFWRRADMDGNRSERRNVIDR